MRITVVYERSNAPSSRLTTAYDDCVTDNSDALKEYEFFIELGRWGWI